jgi:hypothetical protein
MNSDPELFWKFAERQETSRRFFETEMHLWAGWQDLANFRPWGDCLLWVVFYNIQKYPKVLGHFFHGQVV